MGNQGFCTVRLFDASDNPATDQKTTIRFRRMRDQQSVAAKSGLKFPGSYRFPLPAFPQETNLWCEAISSRFRPCNSEIFTLIDREERPVDLSVLREPGKWDGEFDSWDDLPGAMRGMKSVLEASPNIRVREKKQNPVLPRFAGKAYDGVSDSKVILAKASLLNLHAKMTRMIEPVGKERNWFSFVERILEFGRERIVAIVEEEMAAAIETIRSDFSEYTEYKHTPAENHRGNIPAGYSVSTIFSIKSKDDFANIQLTIARAKDPGGNRVCVLDADLDEHGRLLEHFADLLRRPFTGGTHPFDIHEYLLLTYRGIRLGYTLA